MVSSGERKTGSRIEEKPRLLRRPVGLLAMTVLSWPFGRVKQAQMQGPRSPED
jgi:hypothetical protein